MKKDKKKTEEIEVIDIFDELSKNESLKNNFNQYHSEEFVDEKAVNNMDIPHIVISFDLNYEIDKSTLLEESTMEEVKEFIKNQREKTKDYFSQNNKKLLNNMNLELLSKILNV